MSDPPAESESLGSISSLDAVRADDASLPPRNSLARDPSGTYQDQEIHNNVASMGNSTPIQREDSTTQNVRPPADFHSVASAADLPLIWRETSTGGPRRLPTFKEQVADPPPPRPPHGGNQTAITTYDEQVTFIESPPMEAQVTKDQGDSFASHARRNDPFEDAPMATAILVNRVPTKRSHRSNERSSRRNQQDSDEGSWDPNDYSYMRSNRGHFPDDDETSNRRRRSNDRSSRGRSNYGDRPARSNSNDSETSNRERRANNTSNRSRSPDGNERSARRSNDDETNREHQSNDRSNRRRSPDGDERSGRGRSTEDNRSNPRWRHNNRSRSRTVHFDDPSDDSSSSGTGSEPEDNSVPPVRPPGRSDRSRSLRPEPSVHSRYTAMPLSASTFLMDQNGSEHEVGPLFSEDVPVPSRVYGMQLTCAPYFFLSHNGKDAKEHIARPSHWFLEKILKVKAFMDDAVMAPGEDKMLSLLKPAHQCTHAVVVLSPSFRKSEYCVKELNTFMERHDRRDGIRVIPALWRVDNVEGYAEDLDRIVWLRSNSETNDAADYLVSILWPAIMRSLGREPYDQPKLERFLTQYVTKHRTHISIPVSLERLAARRSNCQCCIM